MLGLTIVLELLPEWIATGRRDYLMSQSPPEAEGDTQLACSSERTGLSVEWNLSAALNLVTHSIHGERRE